MSNFKFQITNSILVATGAFVILIDQIVKFVVLNIFPQLIVINANGAWGIMPAWVSIIGLGFLIVYVLKYYKHVLLLWVIIAAGISNMIDRVIYDGVIDYIHISSFPVFNLADSVITCGVIVLLIQVIRQNQDNNLKKSE